MILKQIYKSTKTYILILAVAIIVLLFSATMAYHQMKQVQASADMVAHTHEVKDGITTLFSHYFRLESDEFKNNLLRDSLTDGTFENYISNGQLAFNSLAKLTADNPSQKFRLMQIEKLQDSLYQKLKAQNIKLTRVFPEGVAETLFKIRAISNEMIAEENGLMRAREEEYESRKVLAPYTLLILAFFSLFVFVIAFLRIYKVKVRYRESDAFLRSVLSNTDNIVNFYVPLFNKEQKVIDFKIEFANARNKDYLGLDPDKIIGEKVSEVFPFLRLNGELEDMIKCYEQQKKIVFNRQIVLNKDRMWFKSSVNPLLNGILITAQNITSEEEAKAIQLQLKEQVLEDNKKLKEAESFLNNVLDSSDNIISYYTPVYSDDKKVVDFKLLFSNENIRNLLQKQMVDLERKPMSEILPKNFENGVFELLAGCLENNETIRFEKAYEFNGKKYWFKTTAVKLDNGVLTTSIDTTAEKTAEKHLSTLNERLENQNLQLLDNRAFLTNIFKSISHIVMHLTSIRDATGKIVDLELKFINDKAQPIIGTLPAEIANKKASEIFPVIFTNGVFKKLVDVVENKKPVEYETHYDIDENTAWFHATAIKLGDGVTVTVRDITQEKEKTEQLRLRNLELTRSNTELEAFNRIASHDLQEPLRKIQMFISLITENANDDFSSKNQKYFDKIKNAAQRMQALIINLLSYSRIEGKHENFKKVDLNDALNKVKEDLSVAIADTATTINSTKLPKIQGVPYQLEQLISNLISNAIKYRSLEHKPRIEITSEKVHEKQIPEDFFKNSSYYHKISITDNGIGFSQEHGEKIFEVFQRLHQKPEYSGTGIGLAICKKIIENHHGYIYATSRPKKGSAFVFYLPA